MVKKLVTGLFISAALSYGMSYSESDVQVVEERPSLGFYVDFGSISSSKIIYKEQPQNIPSSSAIRYQDASIDVSPTFGFAGHIPFIWDKYLDATATVGFNQWDITARTGRETDSEGNQPDNENQIIPDEKLDRSFQVFNVIVEGGPELGFPLYTDYKTQQILKPFVQVRGMFIKTFNQTSGSYWKNTQAFGYSYVGGIRYSYNNISLGAGIRNEFVTWSPTYDPIEGDSEKNSLLVEYERNFKPWIALEFSFY